MHKIIIAIDSFKGCLSSSEIAEAVEAGILSACPTVEVIKTPIADGGEGTVEALVHATHGRYVQMEVHNPLMQPTKATYGILGDRKTAVIEMSAASGLALIPWKESNVMHTTTYGTGEMVRNAINQGCRDILLGIGGSATNEGGIGMLQALGFGFADASGQPVAPVGSQLEQIARIETAHVMPELNDCRFHILTDVRNPFCGKEGAAYIFGPQKGATPSDVVALDKGLVHLAALIRQTTGKQIEATAGTGAGGGMAGGCLAFLHAELQPGIEVIKQLLRFDEMIQNADLIFTGEGKIDAQTLQGKVLSGILSSAHRLHIPVIALTGNCREAPLEELYQKGLTALYSIHPAPVPLEQALQPDFALKQVERTAEQIMRTLTCQKRLREAPYKTV